jgi:hypothetical protein
MRRSDIARFSIVPDGADYIFTLPDFSGEGPAYDSRHRFGRTFDQRLTISPSAVRMDQSLQGHDGNLYLNSILKCGSMIPMKR